jgi:hypothetical protein
VINQQHWSAWQVTASWDMDEVNRQMKRITGELIWP